MNHSHLFHEVFPGYGALLAFVDIGTALWLIAYGYAIWQGFKEKTYSIPLVNIALNFTWEFLAAFHMQAPVEAWRIGDILWLLTDSIIVYQLFRYGRARQVIPEIRRFYYPIVVGVFLLALIGQYTFTLAFQDKLGFQDSYIINLLMSVNFIFMYFTRRDASDATYYIAWTKMLGTGIVALGLVGLMPYYYPDPTHRTTPFMNLLYFCCFGFDSVYILLLAKARKELALREGQGVQSAGPTAPTATALARQG